METNQTNRRPVYRATITLEVLVQDSRYNPDSLAEIDNEIMDGDCIGDWSMISLVRVPDDAVEDALLAVGNDGTFFDEGDGEDDDDEFGYRCAYGCGFETDSPGMMAMHFNDGCDEDDDDCDE